MNYILFDGDARNKLLPFTFTRPVADIRVGILTIREKWELLLESTTTTITEEYLSEKWPMVELENNVMINGAYFPSESLLQQIKNLKTNQVIVHQDTYVAFFTAEGEEVDLENFDTIEVAEEPLFIENTWDIFSKNGEAIEQDFYWLTKDRESEPIPDSVFCVNKDRIFVEEGAKLTIASLNATNGPIYIGKDAEVMEGSIVRGPFALCENATLKMGAKIYGPTTVGPHSKVGGEVNNSVIFGYSNKGHDGFLGNSVLGEWCNLGADTNNSNLKNNYAEVRLWSYETEGFARTGLQFCGLMMGDHSKCGINTMFNTGTVVGVSANIFGAGFPRNFVPSFSWGGSSGVTTYKTNKAFEVAEKVMERRDIELTEEDKGILEYVFEETSKFRRS
ncbi:UDP-N-acetylglucosamine diphosphorylase/glucosamine-1-phosphate N-acetyltransferase [Mesonia phycicola]|uniref:UDP-N-acetylglucosamine diphosphorylase/glucosamine-1-phosphate N-acetyltransferase n=1 Tax=Mesonia phycicola TaxID=579105 RepID=A0A1M6DTG4_9FLAO|nr:GlmU family protein [Mesonia phycicola]SHI76429.1 UDP-N-acetylglucosamine diphosphorylase/glucosamine-1-phosphate N-acetyltransferase [Mesonia phycicola]